MSKQLEEGRTFESRVVGKETDKAAGGTTGRLVERDAAEGQEIVVSVGKTIPLAKDFEFARVDAVVKACGTDKDKTIEAARGVVYEILAREEAKISGEAREYDEFEWPEDAGTPIALGLSYGMTLQGKARYSSNRFDLSITEPVSSDEGEKKACVEGAYKRARGWLVPRVREEAKRFSSGGKDGDLGT